MNAVTQALANEIHLELKKAEEEIGTIEINPIGEEIRKFCQIIDDENPIYLQEGIFPPGYIMNLNNRVIQEVFIRILPLFASRIRGIIHAGSEVEFIREMSLKNMYRIRIETSVPVKKNGKMGEYYTIMFKTIMSDEMDEVCAIDHHNFFFRLHEKGGA